MVYSTINSINVYLLTGFLGSGKTTLLNRLISEFPKNLKLMILMNELGEVGIDGTLVARDNLDILEINKGSIFCACVKTDFIKGLYEIAQKIKPDVLLIEATGVANPGDLRKNLKLPIFENCFNFKEQICLIDAPHFLTAYEIFASVERQISTSTKFIINKTDLATKEQIEAIKPIINQYHSNPIINETTYANLNITDLMSFEQCFDVKSEVNQMTESELNQYVDELLNDPEASVAPPDMLMSATFLWKAGKNLLAIKEMTKHLHQEAVRAKGFLTINSKMYMYDYVMGQYNIEAIDEQGMPIKQNQRNVLVIIAPPRNMSSIEQILDKFDFAKIA